MTSPMNSKNPLTPNLLVELFVEELPPKALKKLGDAFAGVLLDQLKGQGLATATSVLTAYASPRRLAAHITGVAAQADSKSAQQKLMPVSVGLDATGNATPALLKRLQALGADASAVAGLKRAMDGKAEALFYESVVTGATLAAGLQKALEEVHRETAHSQSHELSVVARLRVAWLEQREFCAPCARAGRLARRRCCSFEGVGPDLGQHHSGPSV